MDMIPERLAALEPLFGHWRVVSRIGEGGFGKVYKIARKEYGAEYVGALKWIAIPTSYDEISRNYAEGLTHDEIREHYEGLIRALNSEILLMNKLRGNSNIVDYADHQICERKDEIGWDILIRMELLTSLPELVIQGSFSETDVATLGVHICRALSLCAQHSIIHRDIKPDNIFISPDGQFKLGDFGVARVMEKTTDNLTRRGTVAYMSPELFYGNDCDLSSDIYSLGIVMYRLLNVNRLPFVPIDKLPTHNDREQAITRRMRGEILPYPRMGCAKLRKIVLKACAYERKNRYRSADQMARELEDLLASHVLSKAPLFKIADKPVFLRSERSSINQILEIRNKQIEKKPAPAAVASVKKSAVPARVKPRGKRNLALIIIASAMTLALVVLGVVYFTDVNKPAPPAVTAIGTSDMDAIEGQYENSILAFKNPQDKASIEKARDALHSMGAYRLSKDLAIFAQALLDWQNGESEMAKIRFESLVGNSALEKLLNDYGIQGPTAMMAAL